MRRRKAVRPTQSDETPWASTSDNQLPWTIEMLALDRISPAERNARAHSNKQIQQLADSIRRFGAINPVIVNAQDRLVAGTGRWEAAKLVGLRYIPAIRVSHLSPIELRAYALADNKLAECAGWDRPLLAVEIEQLMHELPQIGLDVSITGFEAFEIDALLADQSYAGSDSADENIEPGTGPAVARIGDLFLLGEHRLLVADARDHENFGRLLGRTKADMAILDPPYNVRVQGHVGGRGHIKHREFKLASGEMSPAEFRSFLERTLGLCAAHSINGAIHFVFIDWRHVSELIAAGTAAYDELKNLCVWAKTTPGQGSFYRSQHELVCVFKHGRGQHLNNFGLGQHGRTRTNLWTYPGVSSFRSGRMDELRMHPTVKPVALIADAMRDVSKRGGLVLDAFAGSGSTIIAAERVGRRAVCMEIDPAYADVSIGRWQRLTKRDAVLEGTGSTFDEMASLRSASL